LIIIIIRHHLKPFSHHFVIYIIIQVLLFISVLGTTHLAQEALAGLASTEDFSNVTLRKTDASSRSAVSEYLPYNDVMLLHVKGKLKNYIRVTSPCLVIAR